MPARGHRGCWLNTLTDSASGRRPQPEWIREIDRISTRKPVGVESACEPDGVFLGERSLR